jgi:hypothetical protein
MSSHARCNQHMTMTPEEVSALPAVRALRPTRIPYLEPLSGHSDLLVWHVDVEFYTWPIPPAFAARWSDKEFNVAETWQKRPLAAGADSGCIYSCGEVELTARLRSAGFAAYWISEWSGFSHVESWEPFCIKRSEFSLRAPQLWRYDQDLRDDARNANRGLGRFGGHPDVACVTPAGNVYMEYKGPGDSIKPKQNSWAAAVIEREHPRFTYLAVRGAFRLGTSSADGFVEIASAASEAARSGSAPRADAPQPKEASPRRSQDPLDQKRVRLPKLHRRTISDTLKRDKRWSIVSHTDGWIDFTPPPSARSIDNFADEVRHAVQALGYAPTVRIGRDSSGRPIVRVQTAETLEQAPRGKHGA